LLFKKEDKFAVQLKQISSNLVESTNFFTEYTLNDKNGLKEFSIQMKEYEHKGDSFVHQIIRDLNKVFITPIEREDILALAMHMDDVLDGLESTTALFEMYSIPKADEFMHQFTTAIQKAVLEIDKAVVLIANKKLPPIRRHAIKIKDYESQCDDILRVSIKHLFETEKDPIQLIKYKEIYEEFEETADYCQNVANTFEAIIMKNA
jgi:predicted phosphate transport protein (TIGR00153 family)